MGAKGKPKYTLLGAREVVNLLQISELRYQAEKTVRDSNFDQLKAIATVLNTSPDPRLRVKSFTAGIVADPNAMKYEIIQLAQQYPKQIITASHDDKSKVKVQIYDSMVFGILVFERGAYHLLDEKDIIELYAPETDMDNIDSLVNYFTSDKGKKSYVQFATALKKALKV